MVRTSSNFIERYLLSARPPRRCASPVTRAAVLANGLIVPRLEQPVNLTSRGINVDAAERGVGTRARHEADGSGNRAEELRARVDQHVADGQRPALRDALERRVVAQTRDAFLPSSWRSRRTRGPSRTPSPWPRPRGTRPRHRPRTPFVQSFRRDPGASCPSCRGTRKGVSSLAASMTASANSSAPSPAVGPMGCCGAPCTDSFGGAAHYSDLFLGVGGEELMQTTGRMPDSLMVWR